MKFFVAFAALVAVAVARQAPQPPSIQPVFAPGEDHPVVGPVLVDHPAVGPVFVDHEQVQPGFGPALIDFPVDAEAGSPVVIGPIPAGASPLVQIIVNVAKPAEVPAEAGVGPTNPSIAPEYVQDIPAVGPAIVEDPPVSGVEIADLPAAPVAPVEIGTPQLPVVPVAPVQIGTPQLPSPAVNIPHNLN